MADLTAASVFRLYVDDGVPSSGPNPPSKVDVRDYMVQQEQIVAELLGDVAQVQKTEVRAASTINVTLSSMQDGASFGGVTLATGDRFAPVGQSSGAENGIYVAQASGAPVRATDADTADEMLGATFFVTAGTHLAQTFTCVTTPITLNTTPLVFVQTHDDSAYGLALRADVGDPIAATDEATTLEEKTRELSDLRQAFDDAGMPNRFNKTLAVWGSLYNNSTGIIATGQTTGGASGKIFVEGNEFFAINLDDATAAGTIGARIHLWDVDDNLLAAVDPADGQRALYAAGSRSAVIATSVDTAYITFNVLAASEAAFDNLVASLTVTKTGVAEPFAAYAPNGTGKAVAGLRQIARRFAAQSPSRNLYDPNLADAAYSSSYINDGDGTKLVGTTYATTCTTGIFPVTEAEQYVATLMYCPVLFYFALEIYYWNSDRTFHSRDTPGANFALSEGPVGQATAVFTVPSGAEGASFNISSSALSATAPLRADFDAMRQRFMVHLGDTRLPFEPFAETGAVLPGPDFGKKLIVGIRDSGDYLYVRGPYSDQEDMVEQFWLGSDGSFTDNGCPGVYWLRPIPKGTPPADTIDRFDQQSVDFGLLSDEPPVWFNGGNIIGGPHGILGYEVTKTAHGKTNVDVGSIWQDGGSHQFVLAKIIDSSHAVFAPIPGGTATKWTVDYTLTGTTFTHVSGATHTGSVSGFSSPTLISLFPAIQNKRLTITLDGNTQVSAPGIYAADSVALAHSYGIPNWKSVINALIANVGSSAEPVFNDDAYQTQIEVDFVYTWRYGQATTIHYTNYAVQEYARNPGYMVGLQVGKPYQVVSGDLLFFFAPNTVTETTTSEDYSTPVDITAGNVEFQFDAAERANALYPADRFGFIRKTSGGVPKRGFIAGVSTLFGLGVPNVAVASKNQDAQLSAAQKLYLRLADTHIGDAAAGENLSGMLYRFMYDASADQNILMQCVYQYAGKLYWVIDLVGDLDAEWIEPPLGAFEAMIGKTITTASPGLATNLTLLSQFVGDRGVRVTTGSGGGSMIAEIA